MNIGSSAADIGLSVAILFPALLAPVLILALSVIIVRLLRLPIYFSVLFTVMAIGICLVGGSLALDSAGVVVPGFVDKRLESVELRSQGDWQHQFHVQVRYRLDGSPPIADQPTLNDSAASLTLSPAQFDSVSEGGIAPLRVLPLFRSLALVRIASATTIDSIPWIWIGGSLGVLLVLWLASKLMSTRIGSLVVVILALVGGFGIPITQQYYQWQASEDLTNKPLRATARVLEVTRITQVDPFPCRPGSGSRCGRRSTMYDVAQPYDIVQMSFAPPHAGGMVIAVDAIDVAASETIAAIPGTAVEIAYESAHPRAAHILGRAHSHYWRNALGFTAMIGIFVLVLVVVIWWAAQRLAQRKARKLSRTIAR